MLAHKVVPRLRRVTTLSLLIVAACIYLGAPHRAEATINRQINFQGKLVNSNGTNIANGTYNMEFKIVQGGDGCNPTSGTFPCSGTVLWTEDRVYGSGSPDNRITVTDGIFQVNLGAVTSLPGSVDFNNDTLWLSVNLGNTSQAANFASASGDGEMKPLVRFTAAPYAFNSDTLDGIDSTALGQLANNQTWTGTQTLQPTTNITSAIVKQTSVGSPTADIFKIQTANNTNIVQVTGPAANEAAVTIQSVGATRALTLQSGSGTISLGTTTTVSASGALTVASGGSSDLTLDSASGQVAVATGDFLKLSVSGVSGAVAGDIWYDSAANKFKINENGSTKTLCNLTDGGCGTGGASRLDQIAAATADATINNAANNIVWNWQLTGAESGFTFGESAASTGGGTQNQFIVDLSTQSGSTASPFRVTSNSADGGDIVFNLNNAGDFEIQDAGSAVLAVDDAGLVDINRELAIGNTATPSTTVVAGVDHSFDSTVDCTAGCRGFDATVRANKPTGFASGSIQGFRLATGTDATTVGNAYTLANAIGLTIDSGSLGANTTITNNYGILINSQTKGTADYGLVIQGADTYALWVQANNTRLDGDLAVNGGDITSSGALNITPSGAMVLGATNQTATLQGSTTTITTTGAGNDIVLNSADQAIFKNGGTTVATLDSFGKLDLLSNGFTTTGVSQPIINVSSGITKDNSIESFYVVNFSSTINVSTDPIFGDVLFRDSSNRIVASGITDSGGSISFMSAPSVQAGGSSASAVASVVGLSTDAFLSKASSGNLTVTDVIGARLSAGSIGTGVTVTNRYGAKVNEAAGAGSVGTQYGIYVDNLSKATNDYGVYIGGADTTALWVDSGATQLDGTLNVGDQITASNKGIEFTESDTNPTCAAGNYNIYADLSETKLKKCVNGVVSDIDTGTKDESFTGNGTYTKPTDAVLVIVQAWGPGGGGGGGGSVAAATAATGGGGGGGGAYVTKTLAASSVGSTETVTVPNGAGGGAGGTNAAGSNGSAPSGDTTFGALLTAFRGGGGAKGNNSATGGGGGGGGGSISAGGSSTTAAGATGGNPGAAAAGADGTGQGGGGGGTTTAGSGIYGGGGGGGLAAGGTVGRQGGGSNYGGGGGAGGGSLAATHASTNGGLGGPSSVSGGAGGTGAGGAASGGNTGSPHFGGSGGGGGASNVTADANGGGGGTGGIPGGGGGGGGAATFLTTGTGGAGAAGARGEVRVTTLRGSGSDLAEIYCTNDSSIEAGDTVALDPGLRAGVKKTQKAYDPAAIGAIATNPGLVIGEKEEQCAKPVLVALAGRVPIKVSIENGEIKPGDLLTASSTIGVAMRATKAGQIIGQALAGFSGQGVGTTVVFVKTDFSQGSTAGLVDETTSTDFGKQMLAYMTNEKAPVDQSKQDMSEIFTDRISAAIEITTPKVTADTVAANTIEAATGKDITLKLADDGGFVVKNSTGKQLLSFSQHSASVALDLNVTGGLTIGGDATFQGNALFKSLVTFVEKTVFKSDVSFGGHILTDGEAPTGTTKTAAGAGATASIDGNDTSGQFSLKLGDNPTDGEALALEFKKPYAKPPKIFLTPTNDPAANLKYYVQSTPTGFTITTSDPPSSASISFNYWVVQ